MTIRAACAITTTRSSSRSRRWRQRGASSPPPIPAMSTPPIAPGKPDDLTLFSYTSGTTSRPKGVMLTHANLLSAAAVLAEAEGVRPSDEHLAYLPMAWVGNSLISLALHLWVGFTFNFPEKPETLQRDLRELGPTIALAPPRYLGERADRGSWSAPPTPRRSSAISSISSAGSPSAPALRQPKAGRVPLGLRLCSRDRRGAGLWPAARSARARGAPVSSIPAARRSAPRSSASSARSGSI